MKKILALMLCLVLIVCAFASCGETTEIENTDNTNPVVNNSGNSSDKTEEYKLEGTWKATMTLYDLNPGFTDVSAPEQGGSTTESTDPTDATEPTEGTTASTGTSEPTEPSTDLIGTISDLASNTTVTCTLTFTGDKYTLKMDEAEFNNAVKVMGDICVAYLQVANPGMTAEAFFAENKLTEEQFRANVTAAMGSPTESGTWTLEENKLTLNKTVFYFEAEDEANFNIHIDDVYYYYTKG